MKLYTKRTIRKHTKDAILNAIVEQINTASKDECSFETTYKFNSLCPASIALSIREELTKKDFKVALYHDYSDDCIDRQKKKILRFKSISINWE